MPQETGIQRFSANICRRIAGADKLDPFERDPLSISSPPESMLFGQLPEEGDDSHRGILVGIREVDLVAKDYQPLAGLLGSQNNAADGLVVLAVVLELLHDEPGVGRGRKVDEYHLELWQSL